MGPARRPAAAIRAASNPLRTAAVSRPAPAKSCDVAESRPCAVSASILVGRGSCPGTTPACFLARHAASFACVFCALYGIRPICSWQIGYRSNIPVVRDLRVTLSIAVAGRCRAARCAVVLRFNLPAKIAPAIAHGRHTDRHPARQKPPSARWGTSPSHGYWRGTAFARANTATAAFRPRIDAH